jgi:hypothetical protein
MVMNELLMRIETPLFLALSSQVFSSALNSVIQQAALLQVWLGLDRRGLVGD